MVFVKLGQLRSVSVSFAKIYSKYCDGPTVKRQFASAVRPVRLSCRHE
jgi:hypothetical protein